MHAFDRLLWKKKWDHEQEMVNKITKVNITHPHEFWRMIKTLGLMEDKGIKMEMMREDGTLITDPAQVLGNWKSKYQDLLNSALSGDVAFKEKVMNELDINIEDLAEAEYNKEILVGEIEWALRKLKDGKAAGIDRITNEVLKQDAMLELLL